MSEIGGSLTVAPTAMQEASACASRLIDTAIVDPQTHPKPIALTEDGNRERSGVFKHTTQYYYLGRLLGAQGGGLGNS